MCIVRLHIKSTDSNHKTDIAHTVKVKLVKQCVLTAPILTVCKACRNLLTILCVDGLAIMLKETV
jgi:hypothetical protein